MKNIKIFWIVLILSFILFLIIVLMPKNYTKKYQKNDVRISETYDKKNKLYYFSFIYNNIEFDYLIESKYKIDRILIDKIEIIKNKKDDFCLIPRGEINFIPLCYQDNEILHYSLVNDELKKQLPKNLFKKNNLLENYKDIEIYNENYTYLIWNYDGFYYINKDTKKKIDILKKEFYNIDLIGYTKDYLVVGDYDSNYTFNSFYTIEFKNGNLKKHELNRDIYFDSYFIGFEKNKIYIVDNKEKLMYEFNAKNGEIEKIKSKFLKNNKWEEVNINTLINKKQEFEYSSNYHYLLNENSLYMNCSSKKINTKISEDLTSIIRINNDDIYYIKLHWHLQGYLTSLLGG